MAIMICAAAKDKNFGAQKNRYNNIITIYKRKKISGAENV